MIASMSKHPGKKAAKPKEPTPTIYLRLTAAHEAAVQVYINRQKAKPDRQAVGLAALEHFLEAEGLWPPKDAK
jgi:hypothetical protein